METVDTNNNSIVDSPQQCWLLVAGCGVVPVANFSSFNIKLELKHEFGETGPISDFQFNTN